MSARPVAIALCGLQTLGIGVEDFGAGLAPFGVEAGAAAATTAPVLSVGNPVQQHERDRFGRLCEFSHIEPLIVGGLATCHGAERGPGRKPRLASCCDSPIKRSIARPAAPQRPSDDSSDRVSALGRGCGCRVNGAFLPSSLPQVDDKSFRARGIRGRGTSVRAERIFHDR